MSKKVKIFALVVGILAVGILAYTFLGNSSPAPTVMPLASSAAVSGAMPTMSTALPGGGGPVTTMPGAGTEMNTFSNALAGISGITLDTSIFSNAAYKALRDYPITLGTAVIGRQNPFAPIGADSGSADTSASTLTVQTLAPSKVLTTSAAFGALVTAQGTSGLTGTTVVFQYGLDDTLGSATAPAKVSKSGTAVFTVTGLTPGTTYYVNSVAVQGSTTATGTIMTFTTAGAATH